MFYAIGEQMLIALPLVLGAYITLSLMKLPDFALESAYLSGAVMAFLVKEMPLVSMMTAALLGGSLIGLLVTFLNQYLRIPYLLAGIVTNGLVHGSALFLLSSSVSRFRLSTPINEPLLLVIVGLFVLGFVFILLRSQMGYAFAIHGNNPRFFSNHRISKGVVIAVGVACAHALAGLSGFLFALTSGVLDITMNFGIMMLCLTALMIGKMCIRLRHPHPITPFIGIAGYFLMQQSLLRLGLDLTYFNAFQALFVLAMLVFKMRYSQATLDHLGV